MKTTSDTPEPRKPEAGAPLDPAIVAHIESIALAKIARGLQDDKAIVSKASASEVKMPVEPSKGESAEDIAAAERELIERMGPEYAQYAEELLKEARKELDAELERDLGKAGKASESSVKMSINPEAGESAEAIAEIEKALIEEFGPEFGSSGN